MMRKAAIRPYVKHTGGHVANATFAPAAILGVPAVWAWRLAAVSVITAAAVAGAAIGGWHTPSQIEPALVNLLRFMASLKAGMAIGAAVLADWRLREGGSALVNSGLIASTALMAIAPGLIWGLSHVMAAAALFHAGLLSFLLIAYLDLKSQKSFASFLQKRRFFTS